MVLLIEITPCGLNANERMREVGKEDEDKSCVAANHKSQVHYLSNSFFVTTAVVGLILLVGRQWQYHRG